MKPELVDILRDALRAALGNEFKAYYDGDPDVIPDFNLPAIVVSKQSDTTDMATTTEDDVAETILVKVIYNKKDDWTAKTDEVDLTERRVRRIVEARDATTGRYLNNTVKKVMRETLEQQNLIISGTTTFDLGTLPRPNDVVTFEGHVTMTGTYSVPIR